MDKDNFFAKIKRKFGGKPQGLPEVDNKRKSLKRVGLPKTKVAVQKQNKNTCDDEFILELLQNIIKRDIDLLRGTGIQKLSELYKGADIYDPDNKPICTKSQSQNEYIQYIKELTIQFQKLSADKDREISNKIEQKNRAEAEKAFARKEADRISSEKERIENELKKANTECENKIQKLRPQIIKVAAGIPKTPTKKSLSPKTKATRALEKSYRLGGRTPENERNIRRQDTKRLNEYIQTVGTPTEPLDENRYKVNQNF
jgi:hypothetical protein